MKTRTRTRTKKPFSIKKNEEDFKLSLFLRPDAGIPDSHEEANWLKKDEEDEEEKEEEEEEKEEEEEEEEEERRD